MDGGGGVRGYWTPRPRLGTGRPPIHVRPVDGFLGGVQLFTLVIGEYLSRMHEEIKRRPLYVVADEIGFGREDAAADPPPVGGFRQVVATGTVIRAGLECP